MIPTMKTKTKIDPSIYIDAAMAIATGHHEFSCCAICPDVDKGLTPDRYEARCVYEKIFGIRGYNRMFDSAKERMIALSLAAYVVKCGDFS
jgi:hypothetical protein